MKDSDVIKCDTCSTRQGKEVYIAANVFKFHKKDHKYDFDGRKA